MKRPASNPGDRAKFVTESCGFGRLGFLRGWIAILAGATALRAHDPGISTAQGELRAGVLELTVGFAPADAQQLLPSSARTAATWTETEFTAAKAALQALAAELWDARAGATRVVPVETQVNLADRDSLNFRFVYPCPASGRLMLRAVKLGALPSGHRQFLIITDQRGSTIATKLLSAKDDRIEIDLGPASSRPAENPTAAERVAFFGFFRLGVEHIWTGYDHLLFLFALLVVCRSFRSIVAVVSCFTLAHSLTLALATLDVIQLPSSFVEAAIAVSIVFVGVENLWRRGAEPPGRWALTFAFGLIHGFGFASVLRELGVGADRQGIALPLFTFNLGVEVGQVAIAAVVLPIIWRLRKNEAFVRRGVPALSALVVLAGLYWLLERTIFG